MSNNTNDTTRTTEKPEITLSASASEGDKSDTMENEETATMPPSENPPSPTNLSKLRLPINPCWTRFTDRFIHQHVPEVVTAIALLAIRRPRWTLCSIAFLSLALVVVGYNTNYKLDVDQFKAFAPFGVRPREHQDWIEEESGFPPNDIIFIQLVHANGDNVVGKEGVRRAFEAHEVMRQVEGYDELCAQATYQYNGTVTCQVSSVLRFWNYSQAVFDQTVSSDQDVINAVFSETYPDGTPVDLGAILGNHEALVTDDGTIVVTAQSLPTAFLLPDVGSDVYTFESAALDATLLHRSKEREDEVEQPFRLEVTSQGSYALEFTRAIEKDMPLVPLVFVIMTAFTCTIFFRRHAVESRCLLGLGAVTTILCSILSGYGLMFICGVPLTNLTTLTPFVVFGVGLDDTFVLTGAFARTKPNKAMEDRVRETMKDVGVSISVTTLTTSVAFALGAISNIPAVRWLCLYAMVTIVIDFFYQITFFMALLVLDAKRIKENRRDCCVCLAVRKPEASREEDEEEEQQQFAENEELSQSGKPNFVDRIMVWWADNLLHPVVKAVVLVGFAALFCLCAYSSTNLTQEFKVTELVPSDSYVISFLNAFDDYTARSLPINIYFRDVDQSLPDIQEQMIQFVDELSELEQFGVPSFCWVRDFQTILKDDNEIEQALQNLTFHEQLSTLLSNPTIKEVYGNNIVLDDSGNIHASRCLIFAEKLDLDSVDEQVDLLHAQEEVSASQPINHDRSRWAFFSHDFFYLTWEFYNAVVEEFIFTAVVGVIAVSVISFFCVPHWTASAFVVPMIGVLYVDLIGVIQAAGLHINVVTHVALAMSIGLLVDYIVHILLRYYESSQFPTREAKVKDTLRTMGAAVLSGGLSTLLGVLPLAFSTSEVMRTVFVCFVAMVTLGCGHGLILLPVLLSCVGPESTPVTTMNMTEEEDIRPKTTPAEATGKEMPPAAVDAPDLEMLEPEAIKGGLGERDSSGPVIAEDNQMQSASHNLLNIDA